MAYNCLEESVTIGSGAKFTDMENNEVDEVSGETDDVQDSSQTGNVHGS